MYATPTLAFRSAVVGIENGADTFRVSAFVALAPLASATLTVTDAMVALVGVPEMTPVAASSESPAGSVPAEMLQVSGEAPPVAARVWE
jgi:hypothetical protein